MITAGRRTGGGPRGAIAIASSAAAHGDRIPTAGDGERGLRHAVTAGPASDQEQQTADPRRGQHRQQEERRERAIGTRRATRPESGGSAAAPRLVSGARARAGTTEHRHGHCRRGRGRRRRGRRARRRRGRLHGCRRRRWASQSPWPRASRSAWAWPSASERVSGWAWASAWGSAWGWFGVGFGVGLGVGWAVGGAATVSAVGVTRMLSQVWPLPKVARKEYGHDPAGSLRDPLYSTPAAKSVPVVLRTIEVAAIRSVTDVGAAPVVSLNWTANENVVAVVPEPGLAVPFRIVSVPHVRASAGPTPNPTADTRSAPTRARPTTRHALAPPSGADARRPISWAMPGG